ncbi:hypothetical protein AAT19DRAFT_8830 [Rhodotorula toruloides]|uniref:Uncharacterized protein n=1 Tax=Rhodotorula toruloides TaxID=5286 RepID=A0A2T0AIE5_RHOTO|nr:hypothetical protein AAT19DRAFT_8830 [Rhodotorula toruloides]
MTSSSPWRGLSRPTRLPPTLAAAAFLSALHSHSNRQDALLPRNRRHRRPRRRRIGSKRSLQSRQRCNQRSRRQRRESRLVCHRRKRRIRHRQSGFVRPRRRSERQQRFRPARRRLPHLPVRLDPRWRCPPDWIGSLVGPRCLDERSCQPYRLLLRLRQPLAFRPRQGCSRPCRCSWRKRQRQRRRSWRILYGQLGRCPVLVRTQLGRHLPFDVLARLLRRARRRRWNGRWSRRRPLDALSNLAKPALDDRS